MGYALTAKLRQWRSILANIIARDPWDSPPPICFFRFFLLPRNLGRFDPSGLRQGKRNEERGAFEVRARGPRGQVLHSSLSSFFIRVTIVTGVERNTPAMVDWWFAKDCWRSWGRGLLNPGRRRFWALQANRGRRGSPACNQFFAGPLANLAGLLQVH